MVNGDCLVRSPSRTNLRKLSVLRSQFIFKAIKSFRIKNTVTIGLELEY